MSPLRPGFVGQANPLARLLLSDHTESMPSSRYLDWFRQAKTDLLWGKSSLESGFFPQACFVAQQTAEKALKALCYYRDYDLVKSHSARRIAEALNINGPIREAAQVLDQYYIPARYPDGLPDGAPEDYFTEAQAKQALLYAERIVETVASELPDG